MDKRILALSLFFILFIGGVFAVIPAWGGSTLSITPSRENSATDANAVLTYSGSNMAYLCLGLTDTNTNSSCVAATASTSIALDQFSTLSLAEGKNTIHAFLKSDDENYSTEYGAPTTFDFNLDTTAPTISTSGVADGNYYNTNSKTLTLTVGDSDLSQIWVTLDGGDANYHSSSPQDIVMNGLAEGSHTVTVDANDDLGNTSSTTTINFTVDTNAPVADTITSANTGTWTNDEEPDFTITATDNGAAMTSGTVAFSCSSTGTFQEIAFTSTTVSTFNITATAYDCNTSDGNTPVYSKLKDSAGNWSSVVSTNVLYDNTNPSAPSGLGAVGNDASVYLSWTATGTADNMSGNAGYQIFVNDTLNSTTTDVSKTISGLTNGTSYTFKVRTYDNAGNVSSFTSEVSATPSGTSTTTTTSTEPTSEAFIEKSDVSVDYVKEGDQVDISCNFSVEVDDARVYYKYYNPNQTTQTLVGPTDNVSSLSGDVTISGSYEKIGAWCNGSTSDDSTTSAVKYAYLDNTLPTISWENEDTMFSGGATFTVEATDNKHVSKVEFEFDDVKYGSNKDGDEYSFDLDTEDFENGTYELVAIVTDGAGNEKEIKKDIKISNTTTPEQRKEKAISEAKTKKQIIEDLINYLEQEGLVLSQEMMEKKAEADMLLEEAEGASSDLAVEKSNAAIELYDEINADSAIETISLSEYAYDTDGILSNLLLLGLSATEAERAKSAIESGNVQRTLEVVKVGEEYQAKVKITLINDTNEEVLKVIEVIPKELAATASLINSAHEFIVIQEDPIIEFTVDAPIGAEFKISYGVSGLTESEANALNDNNVIANFAAPPLLIDKDIDVKGRLDNNGLGFILAALTVIIIVLVVAGIGSFVFMQHNKSKVPAFGVVKGESFGSKVKEKFKSDGGKKSGPGKWKHQP